MPILLDATLDLDISTQNDTWQFAYVQDGLPDDATALIVRTLGPTGASSNADCLIMEVFDDEDSTYLNTFWSNNKFFLNQSSCWDLILAYRGPGSIVYRIDPLNGTCSAEIIGYFTEQEFTPYETRQTFTYDTGGALQSVSIAGESWYRPDAEAYLTSVFSGSGYVASKTWKSRTSATMDLRPSVFWSDNNEVWATGNNDTIYPTGYFTGRLVKRSGTDGLKAFSAENKPLGDPDETIYQTGHQMDTQYSFALAFCESSSLLTYVWPRMMTKPTGIPWEPPQGFGGNFFNGRNWPELFLYPSRGTATLGQIDIIFTTHQYYNSDGFAEYVGWPITVTKEGPGPLVMDQPTYGTPYLLQTDAATMALPVVYRTVSGNYSWGGTLVLYLSGGSSNADPTLSLGDAVSTTAMGSNLLGDITNRKAQLGGAAYRCVYVKNTSTTETAYGLILWIENQAHLGNEISIGADPAGVGETAAPIPTEDDTPAGVVFSYPSGEQNGLPLGVLGPQQSVPIWIKRDVDVQNPYKGSETVTLAFSVAK